ncbi:MAG TPA: glutamate--tRNA ligase [Ruminococcaceae bacterium]|nr:glutamate--tRNA ligase [Oscillospiraceae bacterium]
MNNYEKLAELLFPHIQKTPQDYETLYPPRALPEGARVTRFAPSPTGFLHIGGLFTALAGVLTAKASGGVSFLRIEDTDKKREITDGVTAIIEGFRDFGITFSEGVTGFGTESGAYGPYTQSKRAEVYQTIAKSLVQQGLAYPCFCSEEELTQLRDRQEQEGALIKGYFGKYAKCRDLSLEEQEKRIRAGESYVLRLRSNGQEDKRIVFEDMIRGKIEMPENITDVVLLKADGIPTYHFAHAVDDHFMRTTHVVRGDEWIASVPLHIALFKACGFKVPKYAHVSPVMKEDNGGKRKLSKRKDPEAAVSYFVEGGYPKDGVIEYLLTLLNSNFEDWRKANPTADHWDFPYNLKKMSVSGCLFDLAKLSDVCKNIISVMSAQEVLDSVLEWSKKYDGELFELLNADKAYALGIFSIDRGTAKPRKDLAKWDEVKSFVEYFYDSLYQPHFETDERFGADDVKTVLSEYLKVYDPKDEKDAWFEKIKALCEPLGYTPNVKEYKKNPDLYKGHVGDLSGMIRRAVTSRTNTPDLCAIMQLLGEENVRSRINQVINSL